MPSQQIEIILARQLADSLSIPVFIVDTLGNLLFFNEPAESLLGIRYEDTGTMPVSEWSTRFIPTDDEGKPLAPDDLPLVQTLMHQVPAHGQFWIDNRAGNKYKISVTSFPIIGRPQRFLGAAALFWKTDEA